MMDAEASVLGAVLIDPQAFWRVSDLIRAEHFSTQQYRQLWTTVEGMIRRGEASDAVTVGEVNPSLAGIAVQLANDVFSTANVRAYAEIVGDRWLAREVASAGLKIQGIEGTGKSRLTEAQGVLGRLVSGIAGQSKSIKQVMAERVAMMQEQCDRSGKLLGVTTGLPKLDSMTAGWQPGQLVILAGRPSMGKTLLGLQFATVAAQHGAPAHVVTLEMSAAECFARQQSLVSRVPYERMRDARMLNEEDWPKVTKACDELSRLPMVFDDACYELPQAIARIRQAHAQQGTKVVLIDYLTYLRMPKADTAALAVQEITRELKMTAKALGVTIILISQLSRKCEERGDKRPLMSDLRESGAIEQDADIVLMPYRDEYYNPESPHKGFAELLVRKQRNGIVGMVPLFSRLDIQRFEEAEELPHVDTRSHGGVVQFGRGAGRKAPGGQE